MEHLLTEAEIWEKVHAGVQSGEEADRVEPRAVNAWYDADRNLVMFELRNGCVFGFPQREGWGLENATPQELARVEVLPPGDAIAWDELDAHISIPGVLFHLLNVKAWHAKWLGGAKSEAKAAAARKNGKKGGRPRKQATAPKRPVRRATGSGE